MSKAQRLINSHSRIHSRKYLSRPLDLIGNWLQIILAKSVIQVFSQKGRKQEKQNKQLIVSQ
jgi:hypothetical protein